MPVLSNSVRPHRRQPNRLLFPWDSPGKNTGVANLNITVVSQFSHLVVTLWDSMDYSMPGFPVHPQLLELAQTCDYRVGDAIQPCPPLVVLFSSHLQSFPASGSFPVNQFFASGGQSIGASASVLSVNNQDWFPLELTGLISLQSKSLLQHHSSKTSVLQCSDFFIVQLSHPSWLLEKP